MQAPSWANPLIAHRPGIIPLRPLTAGDLLQAVFVALRRSPGTYFGVTLAAWLVFLGVAGALVALGVGALSASDSWGSDLGDAVLISGVLLLGVLSGIVTAALCGLFAYPVNQQAVGRAPTAGETWRHTRSRFLPLVGVYVLVLVVGAAAAIPLLVLTLWSATQGGLLVLVALVALGVLALGATWLSVRLAFCLPAVVVERCGIAEAIRRSFDLTRHVFWRTFGIRFLVVVLTSIASAVISGGFQTAGSLIRLSASGSDVGVLGPVVVIVPLLGSVIAGLVTQPVLALTVGLLHIDARIRGEGYDLVLAHAAAEVTQGRWTEGWVSS